MSEKEKIKYRSGSGPGWSVTVNHLDGAEPKELPVVHPSHNIPFQLFDDDDNLYFEGFMSQKLYDSHRIFDPLDDYGMPGFGCTYMKVKGEHI